MLVEREGRSTTQPDRGTKELGGTINGGQDRYERGRVRGQRAGPWGEQKSRQPPTEPKKLHAGPRVSSEKETHWWAEEEECKRGDGANDTKSKSEIAAQLGKKTDGGRE